MLGFCVLCQQCAEALCRDKDSSLLTSDETDHHKGAERRVQAEFAEGDFLPVEALVVLRGGQLQNRMIRHRGLD